MTLASLPGRNTSPMATLVTRVSDYLQQFAKWSRSSPNIKVGDIVCVRGEVSQPTKWPLARIEQIHPGPDGKVRVVTLRTSKGTYTPPVIKIVPLVTQSDNY